MLNSSPNTGAAAEIVDQHGRSFSSPEPVVTVPAAVLHPLDDPAVWLDEPMYSPPADVDIVQAQKWIDSIMGVTRNNESIYKLVWNGDRRYWNEFYMSWTSDGRPDKPLVARPRVRYYRVLADSNGRPIRDVFPPRWLILTRVEREQYADTWRRESYFQEPMFVGMKTLPNGEHKPEYRQVIKQIRPEEPPPVFWMQFLMISKHDGFCCVQAENTGHVCYGTYLPPTAGPVHELLGAQKQADASLGVRGVFEKVSPNFLTANEEEYNGYLDELQRLEIQAQIYIENPAALVGIAGLQAVDGSYRRARNAAKDFFDRERQNIARKL